MKKKIKENTTIFSCLARYRLNSCNDVYVVIFFNPDTCEILSWKASHKGDSDLINTGFKKLLNQYEINNSKHKIRYCTPNNYSFATRLHSQFVDDYPVIHEDLCLTNRDIISKFYVIDLFIRGFRYTEFNQGNTTIEEFNQSFSNYIMQQICEPFIKQIPDIQMREFLSTLLNLSLFCLNNKEGYSRYFDCWNRSNLGIECEIKSNKTMELKFHELGVFG